MTDLSLSPEDETYTYHNYEGQELCGQTDHGRPQREPTTVILLNAHSIKLTTNGLSL